MGVLLPRIVAFAAEVSRIEVLKNARSRAKKRPPIAIIARVFESVRFPPRSKNHVGSRTTAGMSKR